MDERPNLPGRRILAAVDDNGASMYALSWALDNLVHSNDLLLLLHARFHPHFAHGHYMTYEVLESVKQHQDEICKRVFEQAKKICAAKNVESETVVVHGDPRQLICDMVKKLNADFLIMGSHGYGLIKRTFLGSVSDYCAHYAPCPIVIVKKP